MYTYTSSFRSSPTTTYSSMYCWLLLYGKLERDSLQYRHSAAAAYFDVVVVRKELVEDSTVCCAMVQIVYNVHAGCYIYMAVRN